jgi:predicted kinase
MRQPTLFLTVGLPGTGKTTAARRMEIEKKALRLTKDEWVKALYGHDNPPSAQDVIEGRLIQIGLRVLELGSNVVIDYGLWDRDERSALRQAAADLGAMVEMHYFELTPAEQRRRLDQRQAEASHTTWPMSDEELAVWSAKIDVPTPGELDASRLLVRQLVLQRILLDFFEPRDDLHLFVRRERIVSNILVLITRRENPPMLGIGPEVGLSYLFGPFPH